MPDSPWTHAVNLLYVWGPEEVDGLRSLKPQIHMEPVFEFIARCEQVWSLTIEKRSG